MRDVKQRMMHIGKLEHTSASKRMAVSGGMLQDSCLDYRDRGDHFKLVGLKNLPNTKKH